MKQLSLPYIALSLPDYTWGKEDKKGTYVILSLTDNKAYIRENNKERKMTREELNDLETFLLKEASNKGVLFKTVLRSIIRSLEKEVEG